MSGLFTGVMKLAIVAAIVLIHGYFVTTEYSLVTLRRTRMQQLAAGGDRRAALILDTLDHLQELIAAVQLGVTMASLALGALAEPTVATLIGPALGFIPRSWSPFTAHSVAIALTFLLLTAVDIVIAELVPKTVALRDPERTAFVVIRPIRSFIWLFRPFIGVLNRGGQLVIQATGLAPSAAGNRAHSPEELKMLVAASTQAGVFDPERQEMLVRVLEFSELSARHVMVPRTEVIGLDDSWDRDRVYEVIRKTHHTRYPIYHRTLDEITGMLYVRDLLDRWPVPNTTTLDLRRIGRDPLFVPDSIRIDILLGRMKRSRVHIAIVLDEYGGTAGMVSLEDVLERIVGEVRDEFELEGPSEVEVLPEGDAVIDGLVLVSDVNERFDLSLDEEEYDTIGGLIWGELGREPRVGDTLALNGCRLRVEAMDNLRVASVRLACTPAPARDQGSAERPSGG